MVRMEDAMAKEMAEPDDVPEPLDLFVHIKAIDEDDLMRRESGHEVSYAKYLISPVKKMLCSKLHC